MLVSLHDQLDGVASLAGIVDGILPARKSIAKRQVDPGHVDTREDDLSLGVGCMARGARKRARSAGEDDSSGEWISIVSLHETDAEVGGGIADPRKLILTITNVKVLVADYRTDALGNMRRGGRSSEPGGRGPPVFTRRTCTSRFGRSTGMLGRGHINPIDAPV